MLNDTFMFAFAEGLLMALGAYAAVGIAFAVIFAARGRQAIDPAGTGMPLSARLLILPGAAALWPLLLVKWLRRQSPPLM